MGESDREAAARQSHDRIGSYMGTFMNGGANSATARFGQITPLIDKAIGDMSQMWNNQIGALRGSTGEKLVTAGVAPGSGLNTAYLGAVAPGMATVAGQRGQMEASKADLLNKLFTSQDASVMGLTNADSNVIGHMKDSTLLGDIGAGMGTIAKLGAGLFGPTGLLTAISGLDSVVNGVKSYGETPDSVKWDDYLGGGSTLNPADWKGFDANFWNGIGK